MNEEDESKFNNFSNKILRELKSNTTNTYKGSHGHVKIARNFTNSVILPSFRESRNEPKQHTVTFINAGTGDVSPQNFS